MAAGRRNNLQTPSFIETPAWMQGIRRVQPSRGRAASGTSRRSGSNSPSLEGCPPGRGGRAASGTKAKESPSRHSGAGRNPVVYSRHSRPRGNDGKGVVQAFRHTQDAMLSTEERTWQGRGFLVGKWLGVSAYCPMSPLRIKVIQTVFLSKFEYFREHDNED